MSRISESGELVNKISSSYLSFYMDENDKSHDSYISLASNLSTSFTEYENSPCERFVQETSSDDESLDSHGDQVYESASSLLYTNGDQANGETAHFGKGLSKSNKPFSHTSSNYSVTNETPKPHPKRMTWRRPLQNTVNFRLGLHDDSSYLRKGPRKIKDFIKNSANNSGVKINSLKQMQDDCLSMPYNLEDLSLWSGNQLPETLHVEYSLKTLEKPQVQSGAFKSISSHELARTMESMSREAFSKRFVIVDCRYPYEYNGGHIKSAINIWNWKTLKATFYPDCSTKFKSISSKIPIFYCEFSQKRGPQLAEALRKYDRRCNEWRYPEVDYKEVYLLDGGYKKFFEDKYTQLCDPPSYVTMLATPYKQDLKRFHMHRSKSAIEINAAISDACNDTYFDCNWVRHNSCLLSSPTQFLQTPGLLRWSNDTPNLVNTLRFSESPEPGR